MTELQEIDEILPLLDVSLGGGDSELVAVDNFPVNLAKYITQYAGFSPVRESNIGSFVFERNLGFALSIEGVKHFYFAMPREFVDRAFEGLKKRKVELESLENSKGKGEEKMAMDCDYVRRGDTLVPLTDEIEERSQGAIPLGPVPDLERDEEVARLAEFILGRIKSAQPCALIGVFVGQLGISCSKETLERAAKMLLDKAIPVP